MSRSEACVTGLNDRVRQSPHQTFMTPLCDDRNAARAPSGEMVGLAYWSLPNRTSRGISGVDTREHPPNADADACRAGPTWAGPAADGPIPAGTTGGSQARVRKPS